MRKKFNYKKKLVLTFPHESQLLQHELHPLPFERRINKSKSKMFVLEAKSVSVAEAIIPINITSKISFEKFIKSPSKCFKIF